MGKLSAQEMANAMVHLDRLAPCFGKSSQEFRTWHFIPGTDKTEFDPVTQEQFAAYIAHKRDMLSAHPYVCDGAAKTREYEVSANGQVFGIYLAGSEQAARDMCAQDAGYKSESDMAIRLEKPSELVAELLK